MKVLIIGGVAGGATAAARLRRLDETAEIIILERGGFVSYANCGLPYYVGGVIENKSALTLQTPESFWERFRIEVRVNNEVSAIDPISKTVTVTRREDGSSYTEAYDKLILSPGAKAVRPKLPGIDNPRIFTLRSVEDSYAIHDFIKKNHPKKAVVVGGGFIGLEMAENLVGAGIETIMVQHGNQVMPPLDYDMACQLHSYLRSQGVCLRLKQSVEGFEEKDGALLTKIVGQEPISADFAILAIGVVPETHLAKDAGLTLGQKDSIVVNDRMETSAKDIYALGDAVEITQFVSGQKALIALAGPANKQGRIVADNICGGDSRFKGTQGSSVIKLFDMTVASTGLNEKQLQASSARYDKTINYAASHAGYYPGATNMTIKTLFDPENGKILGAQIVGFEGVDKRLDVLATAIRGGMCAADLEELELSYAPPFSSAKDPVNMVGFTIENLRHGLVRQFHWHDVEQLPRDGSVTLLDTRTPGEFAGGHIPGAVNIPVDQLREKLDLLDKTKPVYVNCQSGLRSYISCRILSQRGFDCKNLAGGYRFYAYIAADAVYDPDPTHPCGIKIEK
ncbi:MAG: FAD-dependent oxidoreductase [Oscillospiraceae bacterium]